MDQAHSLQIALTNTLATNDESTSSQNFSVALVTVELDENYVPGATLSTRLQSHTVPE